MFWVTPSFSPIPLTLQTMAVTAAGAYLGIKAAAFSVCLYLVLGVLGLPVFAGMQSGVGVLMGETGGYLIGFVPGALTTAFATSWLYQFSYEHKFYQFAGIFVSMSFGLLVIYCIGAAQFSMLNSIPILRSLSYTVLPFIWADCIKLFCGAFLVRLLLQVRHRRAGI